MAVRAAAANGNLTTAGTWGLVDSTSYSNSESANTAVTTSVVASSTFTPGAITVDGIAVKIASRAASPTGTFTIELFNSTGTVSVDSVTVNVSDVPTCTATSGTTTPVATAEGGWFFVKFGSSHLLIAATNYSIRVSTSNSTQINLWSSATTNWSRYLRTTTTGAPAAGDDMIVTGEWTAAATVTARTVTMDSTAATDYGSASTSQVTPALSICKSGTLTFGITASTNYIFQLSGHCVIYNGGTYTQGASGSEIPRNSTAIVQFDCAADGDFGLVVRRGATLNMYGLSRTSGKNSTQTKLTVDAAGGATSITIADDTGWLSGDLLCFAPTSQTATQFESKTATGNATATTIAVSALTNAHSGTSPTQGEVGLITRNNQMKAVTAGTVTFVYIGDTGTNVNLSWTWFRYLSTNATGKIGFYVNTTTGSTLVVDSCALSDFDCAWFIIIATVLGTITFTNNVCYNFGVSNAGNNGGWTTNAAATGTWTCSGNMFCGSATANFNMIQLADVGGTFTNNSVTGNQGATNFPGIMLNEVDATLGTFSGLSVHSNLGAGIRQNVRMNGVIDTTNSWRHNSYGYVLVEGQTSGGGLTLSNGLVFGNTLAAITTASTPIAPMNLVLNNITAAGDSTFACATGFFPGAVGGNITMRSCSFSPTTGIFRQMTNDFVFNNNCAQFNIIADNSIFNGTNLYTGASTLISPTVPTLQAQNFGAVANDNRSYFANGTSTMGVIQTNTSTVYSTNPRSEQMTPASASVKLQSGSILVPCASGKAATPIVQVQKNGTYNGNAPRLIVKRQDSMGITSDTVLATFSASANTWQALTGTTSVAPQDGVFEFIVDCDGTAGSVFVGDDTATTA